MGTVDSEQDKPPSPQASLCPAGSKMSGTERAVRKGSEPWRKKSSSQGTQLIPGAGALMLEPQFGGRDVTQHCQVGGQGPSLRIVRWH